MVEHGTSVATVPFLQSMSDELADVMLEIVDLVLRNNTIERVYFKQPQDVIPQPMTAANPSEPDKTKLSVNKSAPAPKNEQLKSSPGSPDTQK